MYPIFSDDTGKERTLIAFALDRVSTWKWYGFTEVSNNGGDMCYYGLFDGMVREFCTFSAKDLASYGITVETSPDVLSQLAPPRGWKRQ